MELTENRNEEEIKYKNIKTVIRSNDSYNKIPYLIRIKNIKNFKKSYKKYRNGEKSRPVVIKNIKTNKYTLVWSGSS